jgi:hypothetical protein
LNSDDWLLTNALLTLAGALSSTPEAAAVYGQAWHFRQASGRQKPVWVETFDADRLALRCIICQPATLIRRSAWQAVNGLNEHLQLAVAVNREHKGAKTQRQRRQHYREAMSVVRQHYGRVPLKWWWAQPYAVWWKSVIS